MKNVSNPKRVQGQHGTDTDMAKHRSQAIRSKRRMNERN